MVEFHPSKVTVASSTLVRRSRTQDAYGMCKALFGSPKGASFLRISPIFAKIKSHSGVVSTRKSR